MLLFSAVLTLRVAASPREELAKCFNMKHASKKCSVNAQHLLKRGTSIKYVVMWRREAANPRGKMFSIVGNTNAQLVNLTCLSGSRRKRN